MIMHLSNRLSNKIAFPPKILPSY
uniref:Uncharacterized protein n=1 Tax=Arundo donax TaxID=35708 RepID=A0A0A9FQ01_ARUDO